MKRKRTLVGCLSALITLAIHSIHAFAVVPCPTMSSCEDTSDGNDYSFDEIGGAIHHVSELIALQQPAPTSTSAESALKSTDWSLGESYFTFTISVGVSAILGKLDIPIDPNRAGDLAAYTVSVPPVLSPIAAKVSLTGQVTGIQASMSDPFFGAVGELGVGTSFTKAQPNAYGTARLFNISVEGALEVGPGTYNAYGELERQIYYLYGIPYGTHGGVQYAPY